MECYLPFLCRNCCCADKQIRLDNFKINMTIEVEAFIKFKGKLFEYDPRLRNHLIENILKSINSKVTAIVAPVHRWKKRVCFLSTLDRVLQIYYENKNSQQLLIAMFPDEKVNRTVPIQLAKTWRLKLGLDFLPQNKYSFNDPESDKPIKILAGTPFKVIDLITQKMAHIKQLNLLMYDVDVMLDDPAYYMVIYKVMNLLQSKPQMIFTTNEFTCKVKRFCQRFSPDGTYIQVPLNKRFKRFNSKSPLQLTREIRQDIKKNFKNKLKRTYAVRTILHLIALNNIVIIVRETSGRFKNYCSYRAMLDRIVKFSQSFTETFSSKSFQVVIVFPDENKVDKNERKPVTMAGVRAVAETILERRVNDSKWSWNDITSGKTINIVAGLPNEVKYLFKQNVSNIKRNIKYLGVLIFDVDVLLNDRHDKRALKSLIKLFKPLTMHSQVILTARDELKENDAVDRFGRRFSGRLNEYRNVQMGTTLDKFKLLVDKSKVDLNLSRIQ